AGGQIYSAPTVADDGTVYVASFASNAPFYALNGADGSIKWETTKVDFRVAATLGPDGAVFVPGGPTTGFTGGFTAFNSDGTIRWTSPFVGEMFFPTHFSTPV